VIKGDRPLFGADVHAMGRIPRRGLGIRFAFGAAISTIAALIGMWFGPKAGGLLLAFPAILPATLTLIEQEESQRKVEAIDTGAIAGAAALVAFAAVAWWLLPSVGVAAALVAATVVWLVSAIGLYLVLRVVFRERA
jgi:uncharacterized membrane protein (GlpM family)